MIVLTCVRFFTYVGLLAGAGLIGFVVYNQFVTMSEKRKSRSRRTETGTESSNMSAEWLEGTAADPNRGKSPKKNRPTKKDD
jgi:hypothetical protein